MRSLLIIILLAVVLALVGWVSFSSPDGNPTIRVNSEKVKADTSALLEKGKQAIDRADSD